MANLHEQIKSGKLEVMHQGESKVFDMPEWMVALGTDDTLQNTDKIMDVLLDHDILLGFLHAGLKECLVGLRAHIRPKEGVSISSKAGDPATFKPQVQGVPKAKKTVTPEQAIEVLKNTMTKEELQALLATMA